jgi:hypothetical protein
MAVRGNEFCLKAVLPDLDKKIILKVKSPAFRK